MLQYSFLIEISSYLFITEVPKLCGKNLSQNGKLSLLYYYPNLPLKLVPAIFYQIFIFSPNDGPSKTVKIVFDFI